MMYNDKTSNLRLFWLENMIMWTVEVMKDILIGIKDFN